MGAGRQGQVCRQEGQVNTSAPRSPTSRAMIRAFLGIPDYLAPRPVTYRYSQEALDVLTTLPGPPGKGTTVVYGPGNRPWLIGNNYMQPVV